MKFCDENNNCIIQKEVIRHNEWKDSFSLIFNKLKTTRRSDSPDKKYVKTSKPNI
jgi:hypothetical protein